MINVDLQKLIQALDAETRRDLERSAERCVARGGSKILVEDLMLGLLERPNGLLSRLHRELAESPPCFRPTTHSIRVVRAGSHRWPSRC